MQSLQQKRVAFVRSNTENVCVGVCVCVCVCASRRTRVRIPSHHCTHLKGDMVRFVFASTCAVVVMQKVRVVAFECLELSQGRQTQNITRGRQRDLRT